MPRKKQEPSLAPWAVTQADIDATTKLEEAFATTRCLPPEDIIPDEFFGWAKGATGNIYFHMSDALFTGSPMPVGEVTFNEGFREDGEALFRFLMAHMRSFEPSHGHKIAGVAFIISKIITITPEK